MTTYAKIYHRKTPTFMPMSTDECVTAILSDEYAYAGAVDLPMRSELGDMTMLIEHAYMGSQNHALPWTNATTRSTSVGDLIVIGEAVFQVRHVGCRRMVREGSWQERAIVKLLEVSNEDG